MAPLESDRLLSATEISAHPVSAAGDSHLSRIRDDITDDEDLEAGDLAAESSDFAENLEMSLAEKSSEISAFSSYLTTRNQEIDEAPLLFKGDGEMSSAAASPHLTISTRIAPVDTPQTSGTSPSYFRSRSLEAPGSPAIFSPNHSRTLCRICLEHEGTQYLLPYLFPYLLDLESTDITLQSSSATPCLHPLSAVFCPSDTLSEQYQREADQLTSGNSC